MSAALEKAAQEEKADSDSDSSSSDSDSSSDSSSGIGLQRQSEKAPKSKAKPKKKAENKKEKTESAEVNPAPDGQASSAVPSGTDQQKVDKPEKEKIDKTDKMTATQLLEKAGYCLKSLEEISTWSIWTSSIKGKDVDSRIAKAVDMTSKLERRSGEPGLPDMAVKLTEEGNRVSNHMHLLQPLISSNPSDVEDGLTGQEKCDGFLEILQSWKGEQITSSLTDVGRKLCDLLMSSEGSNGIFYRFVACKESEQTFFTLGSLKKSAENKPPGSQDDNTLAHVAQVQQNLLNYFLDRFRTANESAAKVLDSIPRDWFLPEICRQQAGSVGLVVGQLPKRVQHPVLQDTVR